MMSSIWPAIAATAATCAVIISFSIFWVQRRNFLVSVRPEIVLEDWSRESPNEAGQPADRIMFRKVRNVGHGAAHTVVINASSMNEEQKPLTVLTTMLLPVLAAGDESLVEGAISVWWKNVKAKAVAPKTVHIAVEITCWDSGGMRHVTSYSLFANEPTASKTGINQVAPGVMMGVRRTTTKAVWWLKLSSKLDAWWIELCKRVRTLRDRVAIACKLKI